jgi:hypothetical protein
MAESLRGWGLARRGSGGAQVQEVRIRVDRGYHPTAIKALAGRPLRLVFDRGDDDPCTERVVFSMPHFERRLAANGSTAVDLPSGPPGRIRFTCGMGRYRGEVVLVEPAAPWRRFRLGALLAGIASGIVIVVVALVGIAPAAAAIVALAGAIALLSIAVVLAVVLTSQRR